MPTDRAILERLHEILVVPGVWVGGLSEAAISGQFWAHVDRNPACRCLITGLNDAVAQLIPVVGDPESSDYPGFDYTTRGRVIEKMLDQIPPEELAAFEKDQNEFTLMAWNDTRSRTHEQVLGLIQNTIQLEPA
jgi:hypothetical protein